MVRYNANTPRSWSDGLLAEQQAAASYVDTNTRLLAGPGTGKTRTLTARVEYLILEKKAEPDSVVALTFTRAAAGELRDRVEKVLAGKVAGRPGIMTLHAFALRTLLLNARRLSRLPKPLRIVDDWEERHIVKEDLKRIARSSIDEITDHLNALSADWDTLRADDESPDPLKADAGFVGAWQEHRTIYGYTLRAELVYQLKRALEQDDFELGKNLGHLLIDEYQDLNACDLSVVGHLASKGAQIFAAGDDDQSIYGFRHANPEGIRRFNTDHAPAKDLPLATCMRCDRAIMDLARFVADLDTARIKKPWRPRNAAGDGEIALLKFSTGNAESETIAGVCKHLITSEGYRPEEILVLVRSDRYGAFSKPLTEDMHLAAVPFHSNVGADSTLDSRAGRSLLSLLRLASFDSDNLAWRTLLMVRSNGVGTVAIERIEDLARTSGSTFASALAASAEHEGSPPALRNEYGALKKILGRVQELVGDPETVLSGEQLGVALTRVVAALADGGISGLEAAQDHLIGEVERGDIDSFSKLLAVLSMAGLTPDQELAPDAVNMLTMHKAKGLSARAVVVMACEDEYVPGREESLGGQADERRLLYVSLTRARQKLFLTYSTKRTGQQRHSGRNSGRIRRTLTRFLRDAPLHPQDGEAFLLNLTR